MLAAGCSAKLEPEIKTVEVINVRWACDCADYIETTFFKNPGYEIKADDCIFIEAANNELLKTETLYASNPYGMHLKLTGNYYAGSGISKTYERKTPEKPSNAKVFRYTAIEILKKE